MIFYVSVKINRCFCLHQYSVLNVMYCILWAPTSRLWRGRPTTKRQSCVQVSLEENQQLFQVCKSRWRLQVSASQPEPLLSLFDLFYQNGSSTYRRPSARADWVNVWSLFHMLKELKQYWNVKWTIKHFLHDWDHIIKLIIIIACYMQ